jgi:hypothetical protein
LRQRASAVLTLRVEATDSKKVTQVVTNAYAVG